MSYSFKVEKFSRVFQPILSGVKFTDSLDEFLESVVERKSVKVSERKTILFNYVEESASDHEILKQLEPIGNSLCIFMANMMNGRYFQRAQVIEQSLTKDVKILALSEATSDDVEKQFKPILQHFNEISVLSPCEQTVDGKKSSYSLVLVDGSSIDDLEFSFHIATLFITVAALKDSRGKLGL